MNKICNEYCKLIKSKFPDKVKSIVIYGSNIYNESSSDLDVCLIVDEIDSELQESIISETLMFHKIKNLKVDDEIPHTNKLIYTVAEIEDTLMNPPFFEDGKVIIHDIIKDKDFLSSKEMKQRLLLNIFTTDHLTIGESTIKYELQAFKIIINVIINYFKIENKSEEEILECMYTNRYTGASGEMYLGYKKNYQEKEMYLRRKIRKFLK